MASDKLAMIANYFDAPKEYHISAIGTGGIVSLYIHADTWDEALSKFFEQVSVEGTVQVAMRLVSLEPKPKEAA